MFKKFETQNISGISKQRFLSLRAYNLKSYAIISPRNMKMSTSGIFRNPSSSDRHQLKHSDRVGRTLSANTLRSGSET